MPYGASCSYRMYHTHRNVPHTAHHTLCGPPAVTVARSAPPAPPRAQSRRGSRQPRVRTPRTGEQTPATPACRTHGLSCVGWAQALRAVGVGRDRQRRERPAREQRGVGKRGRAHVGGGMPAEHQPAGDGAVDALGHGRAAVQADSP
eukprot:357371-Chlamydomonas_euryale.AAC.1